MIGMDFQGGMANRPQHKDFFSANEQGKPRKRGWGTSIVRTEDLGDIDRADDTIDAAREELHGNIVHFIA